MVYQVKFEDLTQQSYHISETLKLVLLRSANYSSFVSLCILTGNVTKFGDAKLAIYFENYTDIKISIL